jgi:hypothetical protein
MNLLTEYFGIIIGISVVGVFQEGALPLWFRLYYLVIVAFQVFLLDYIVEAWPKLFRKRLSGYLVIVLIGAGVTSILEEAIRRQTPVGVDSITVLSPYIAMLVWVIVAEIRPYLIDFVEESIR